MIDISILIPNVVILVLLIVPGYLIAKFRLAGDGFGKGLSNVVLYIAQPALFIAGYVTVDATREVALRMVATFVLACLFHLFFYATGCLVFRRAPEARKKVLIFSTVFTNAGYKGLPLLEALFFETHPEITIYGTVYCLAFNVMGWSLGAYIYTKDKQYISIKKIILNPATISCLVGILFFIFSAFPVLRNSVVAPLFRSPDSIVYSLMNSLKALVAPLSMFVTGLRIAQLKLKPLLKDARLYTNFVLTLLILPAAVFGFMKLLSLTGLYHDDLTMTVLLMSAAAPAAAMTCMFAEKFDGDGVYASAIVSLTSILCVVSMPLVCSLAQFY